MLIDNNKHILFNKFYLCKANPKVLCKSEKLFLHINKNLCFLQFHCGRSEDLIVLFTGTH